METKLAPASHSRGRPARGSANGTGARRSKALTPDTSATPEPIVGNREADAFVSDEPPRVAMVSSSYLTIPAPKTGGAEVMIATLIDELTERGVEGELFATRASHGGYRHPWPCNSLFERPPHWSSAKDELAHNRFAAEGISRNVSFDIIHAHNPGFLALASELELPVVYTHHRTLDHERTLLEGVRRQMGLTTPPSIYEIAPGAFYVSISKQLQRHFGLPPQGMVVHHGLRPDDFRLGTPDPRTVAFLGRLVRAKGVHTAIDVAEHAGLRIRVAGPTRTWEGDSNFNSEQLWPRLSRPHVEYLGELAHGPKVDLLSRARALLLPLEWEEPFGLVAIEAMLCGCPVIAYGKGAMPELVVEGVTGFIARDEAHMVQLLHGQAHPEHFDRQRCRQEAIDLFSSGRMAEDYLRIYRGLIRLTEEPVL